MSTFQFPKGYGYVFSVLGASGFMNIYLMLKVSKARKEYNVDYPDLYARESNEKKKEFDCVQRAHQNTLESYPIVMLQMVLGGMVYPVWSAIFGGIWTVSRVIYGYGYAKSGPKGRMLGGILSHLGDIPLMGMILKIGYDMIKKDNSV